MSDSDDDQPPSAERRRADGELLPRRTVAAVCFGIGIPAGAAIAFVAARYNPWWGLLAGVVLGLVFSTITFALLIRHTRSPRSR